MGAKLSQLVATSTLADADLLYTAKSPFGSTDSKKITVANFKTAIFNSPQFTTGDAGTYDKYAFIKTSPSVVNQGGLIFSNVYNNTAGYNGFKMTSAFNTTVASSVFSMGFVDLDNTETFTTNSNGFLNFYNNSSSGYMYARVPILSSSSINTVYNIVTTVASTNPSTYSQALTYAGNLVSTPYLDNGVASLVTFSNTDDNASKPKAGIICEMTSAGTGLFFGTSADYGTGVTNYGLALNPQGKVLFRITTSASAQVNFLVSSDPITPVDGDMWYNGTNLKFRKGGTTHTII